MDSTSIPQILHLCRGNHSLTSSEAADRDGNIREQSSQIRLIKKAVPRNTSNEYQASQSYPNKNYYADCNRLTTPPTVRMDTIPRHTQTKLSTRRNNPRENTAGQPGYYEPNTMILDHLAFSSKLCESRRSSGRAFTCVFRRSFDLKLFRSTAVFVHAANPGNLSRKVCCFSYYKVRIVRTFEYPPFGSTSNPTLSD